MKTLVIVEHDNVELKSSTLNTVTAANQLASTCDALVIGHECDSVVQTAAKIEGVEKVIQIEAPDFQPLLAESLAYAIVEFAKSYDAILVPATTFGKNLMPRIAAMLDVCQVSDVSKIIDKNTFEHPIYAGNAIETVEVFDEKIVLTIRPTAFDAANSDVDSAMIEKVSYSNHFNKTQFIKRELSMSERPDLSEASTIVSGGRGLQSGEKFALIEELADCLGAAVGASRAAVDAGFVPNDYQVGQTGKIVAPNLYIAVGISGAIQHLAGMKDSKVIVAINKDEDAPIFQIATYGLVGDLFEIIPELINKLKQ